MIEFMVMGLPRSGTAWVSNLLTTDTTHCLHDALAFHTVDELDTLTFTKSLGVAETGLFLLPSWVNAHPARKIVIHRNITDINKSLLACGLDQLDLDIEERLYSLDALHIPFEDLFIEDKAKYIYQYILDKPFDAERYRLLINLNVQTTAGAQEPDTRVFQDFIKRVSTEHQNESK